MAQPTLVAENLIADIGSLNKRIEHAKQENESIRTKIQEVAHSKGGSALPAAIEACVKENIGLYKAQERQTALEKKAAVKEDILMHLKSKKCTWANDKNCERKSLLSILNIGLNVLEISGGEAKVEFVVDTKRIVTRYRCAEEKFSLISIEPGVSGSSLEIMQQLLDQTNDICGLLSAAKNNSS